MNRHIRIMAAVLLLLPLGAQAQIYRCAQGDTETFSQIPCAASAEPVNIEDRPLFSPAAATGAEAAAGAVAGPRTQTETPSDSLAAFVTRLKEQRASQLDELDQQIIDLEKALEAPVDGEPDAMRQAYLEEELESLIAARESIAEQYDSMITEAQRRVIQLSAASPADT